MIMKRDQLKFLWWSSLEYFKDSKTIYDLDAPFVFNLSKAIFDNKNDPPKFVEIEKRRKFLKKDHTPFERFDFGQGSLNQSLNSERVKISTLVRSSSILPYYGRLLSRLVKYLIRLFPFTQLIVIR